MNKFIELKSVNVKNLTKLFQNSSIFKKNQLSFYIDSTQENDIYKSFAVNDSKTMIKYIESDLKEYCESIEKNFEGRSTSIFSSSEKIMNILKNLGTATCDIKIIFTESEKYGNLSKMIKISNQYFEVNLPAMSEIVCDTVSDNLYYDDKLRDRFSSAKIAYSFKISDIKQILSCMSIDDANTKFYMYNNEGTAYFSELPSDSEAVVTNVDELTALDNIYKYTLSPVENQSLDKIFNAVSKDLFKNVNSNITYSADVIEINKSVYSLRLISDPDICSEMYIVSTLKL